MSVVVRRMLSGPPIRGARKLGVPMPPVLSEEAAAGTACDSGRKIGGCSMTQPTQLSGLRDLQGRFDAFLIDQFGVLRDGRGPYPNADSTLAALKQTGVRIIILSNSGKRSAENDRRLAKIGFDPASWDWFLTSGEVAWQMLAAEATKAQGGPARRCLLISRDGDTSPLGGLHLERTATGENADIVLIAASEGDIHDLDYYRNLLEPGRPGTVAFHVYAPTRIRSC